MATPKDIQILKVVGTLKAAIELGNAVDATAEAAKLIAMVSTGIAVESVLRVYSGLNGLGTAMSEWRLGRAVSGNEVDITRTTFVAGQVAAQIVGAGIDWVREWNIGGKLFDLLHDDAGIEAVSSDVNRDYTAARGWTLPRDPLVLDLDGDGIETVGINPLDPVLFDHDNDGVRTGTGWIKSDDGLLVLDRNGNGVIDGGAELFGDNTPGAAGTLAANGYIALQGQDTNADGRINSQDTSYTQLRVWRDLNQDGISQAGELQTLGQAGIASIGVAGTTTNINLGNGNTQIASGSFTRTNGSTGQSGTAELAGSYLLAGSDRRYLISSIYRIIPMGCKTKKHKIALLLSCKKREISKQLQVGKL
jgi:hypothetical protein